LQELRPKIEATIRQMVERAVDVPEAQEFGISDFAFRHADYPTYRRKGWDIGSGPTEGGCKIIGERLNGSGMRLGGGGRGHRGGHLWDGFWSGPHRAAA
jgi:hypothetical protein